MIIVLAVATAGSVTALFLRGFKVQDFTEQLKSKDLNTPTMKVWLLEAQGYDSKMDAYKAGITAANNGLGVYVLPEDGKWTWVVGVYATETAANNALSQIDLTAEIKLQVYQISGKKFQMAPELLAPCQQVLTAAQNIFNLLLDLRTAIQNSTDINNLQLDLTRQYNQIKSAAETLQTMNATVQNELIATVIYTANQNLLGLQEIIYAAPNLAVVNTALLTTIFSLDNF